MGLFMRAPIWVAINPMGGIPMWNVCWIEWPNETVLQTASKEEAEACYIAFNLTEPMVYMYFREPGRRRPLDKKHPGE
tara:strand:- start:1621 stop:1854 length:234 start_codon:yes stop_codon:yes gene_type:complete